MLVAEKMPNSVLRRKIVLILLYKLPDLKKTNYPINSQKLFRGQPIKKGQICFFGLEKAKLGNSGDESDEIVRPSYCICRPLTINTWTTYGPAVQQCYRACLKLDRATWPARPAFAFAQSASFQVQACTRTG